MNPFVPKKEGGEELKQGWRINVTNSGLNRYI